jgi:hypothetical protein
MAHFETLETLCDYDQIFILTRDYAAFGYTRITAQEYRQLQTDDEEEDKPAEDIPVNKIKGNQTIYPDNPAFHDYGDDSFLNSNNLKQDCRLYFKRDKALAGRDEKDSLKKKYDALKTECDELELEKAKRKASATTYFFFGTLNLVLGFLTLFTGAVLTIIGFVDVDHPELKEPGIVFLSFGGALFLIGFVLFAIYIVKNNNKALWNKTQTQLEERLQKRADLVYQAAGKNPIDAGIASRINVDVQVKK